MTRSNSKTSVRGSNVIFGAPADDTLSPTPSFRTENPTSSETITLQPTPSEFTSITLSPTPSDFVADKTLQPTPTDFSSITLQPTPTSFVPGDVTSSPTILGPNNVVWTDVDTIAVIAVLGAVIVAIVIWCFLSAGYGYQNSKPVPASGSGDTSAAASTEDTATETTPLMVDPKTARVAIL